MPISSDETRELRLKHKDSRRFDLKAVDSKEIPGGSHGNVFVVRKQKAQGDLVSTYIYKPVKYDKVQDIPIYESIAGDIYAFFSRDIFTKARVITKPVNGKVSREIVAVVSQKFEGDFVSAKKLRPEQYREIKNNFKEQLAQLQVGAYALAESDLHAGNWGVLQDNDGKILKLVKIDHDMSMFDLTAEFYDLDKTCSNLKYFLTWPNLIFDREVGHEIVSFDIRTFPNLRFAKPHFWIGLGAGNPRQIESDITAFFKDLVDNKDYQYYKFREFSKVFLMTDKQINAICLSHSRDKSEADKYANYVLDRRDKMQQALLSMPEFRDFILNNKDQLIKELSEYTQSYNKKYYFKQDITIDGTEYKIGDVKPKYIDFIYEGNTAKDIIDKLYKDFLNTPEEQLKILDRLIRIEELKRITDPRKEQCLNTAKDQLDLLGKSAYMKYSLIYKKIFSEQEKISNAKKRLAELDVSVDTSIEKFIPSADSNTSNSVSGEMKSVNGQDKDNGTSTPKGPASK